MSLSVVRRERRPERRGGRSPVAAVLVAALVASVVQAVPAVAVAAPQAVYHDPRELSSWPNPQQEGRKHDSPKAAGDFGR